MHNDSQYGILWRATEHGVINMRGIFALGAFAYAGFHFGKYYNAAVEETEAKNAQKTVKTPRQSVGQLIVRLDDYRSKSRKKDRK